MRSEDFPALFIASDSASNRFQATYLRYIRAEYALLIFASILSLSAFSGRPFYIAFAGVFVLASVILLTRALSKPEQDWYKCRALAESVKTMTWRYVMRSEPFQDDPALSDARERFRSHLSELFSTNRNIAERINEEWSANDQITRSMDDIRSKSMVDRVHLYKVLRINDQRSWYQKKSVWNRRRARAWVTAGVTAYLLAAGLSLARLQFPNWQNWPIDPVIVVASSIIGWMQIKRFNELATAYNVTAIEIGLLLPKLDNVNNEKSFSEFVSEGELAFSREHTMWIARQTS